MFLLFLFSIFLLKNCLAQPGSWNYACESLICDPPKKCVVQDQVAQCLLLPETPGSVLPAGLLTTIAPTSEIGQTTTNTLLPTFPNIFGGLGQPQPANSGSSTPSPFAPFLNLFTPAPPVNIPTLAPATTTTKSKVDICTLPPLTGNCSKARIMWYYDTETGKCERFSYSGCGNENRFPSKIQCEQRCPGIGKR